MTSNADFGRLSATIVRRGLLQFKDNPKRQLPSLFSFTGIKAKAWWTVEDFEKSGSTELSWVQELEKNSSEIYREYCALKSKSDYDTKGENKLHDGEWSWHSFIQKGKWNQELSESCPTTFNLLKFVPDLMLGLPFSYCFFSNLKANSSISPHYGPTNLRVRCHLPLALPSSGDVGIEVGGERCRWEEGKVMFFDDSFLHRTWNNSNHEERVILLFDLWHPEISIQERKWIIEMFDSVNKNV